MESKKLFSKDILKISHLPTVMLVIGYITYWLELYFIKRGQGLTSGLAWILFILCSVFLAARKKKETFQLIRSFFARFKKEERFARFFLIFSFGIVFFMLMIISRAYLLPLHLPQEFDAINYHYTLPRQHLILGSFGHINWSSADLFLLPIDFALAPYWLATGIPNKLPQFLFLLCLIFVLISLVRRFGSGSLLNSCLILFAVFGAHFIAIQMGTAMLDIIISYLFFSAIDSFLAGSIYLSAVEFSFFFWSKPFIPVQSVVIIIAIVLLRLCLKNPGFSSVTWGFGEPIGYAQKSAYFKRLKKSLIAFILCSAVIASPFLVKSAYYSGTPLFPFGAGIVNMNRNLDKDSKEWGSLLESSRIYATRGKDDFGYGRGLVSFVRHFWLISVPGKGGAINRFDYPAGLMYLIFLGPFLFLLFQSLKRKEFAILALFAAVYWGTWWFGSQQTRFLYIPILIMMVSVLSRGVVPSRIFMSAVFVALSITAVSVFRAHGKDLLLPASEVLREKDRQILKMNEEYALSGRTDKVSLDYYDVAYAAFPVEVTKESFPWVLYVGNK